MTYTKDYLYCKKSSINEGIVVYWYTKNYWPKYITSKNFILDEDAFNEIFGSDDDNHDNKIEDDNDDDDDDDGDDDDDDDIEDDDDDDFDDAKELASKSIEFLGTIIKNIIKDTMLKKLEKYINKKINDENNVVT